MSSESPAVVLFDSAGNQIATAAGTSASSALNIQGITGGTVVATSNLSIGATGAGVPADATMAGGEVQALQSGLTPGDLYPLSLTTTGSLRVDGSSVTQPVSGTVTANQGGTWTVQPGNTANTTPWLVTGSGTTGAPAAGIITIQGNASGVPVPISGTVTATNPSVGATAATPPADATYMGALVTTAAESSLTSGDMYPLNLTTTGLLRVDGSNVTQPVSVAGTVAVTQSGSWTNTVTQATASNLNAAVVGIGTAGTPSGGVLTIQGVTGMTPITVNIGSSATGTITSVTSSAASKTLLASNTARKGATIYSAAASGNLLYVALSGTASTTVYTIKIWPGSYWELPIDYTGIITGIWTTADADVALVTELT